MRMPPHTNIVPFDALVVEKIEGVDRVVGFTARYIPGGTLHEDGDRLFKLKYLEQLTSVVDYLNLCLGIVHGDISPWNLLIDAETDSIQLFDFNFGSKLGWEGDEENGKEFEYDADRNDVKFVIFILYELIAREFSFRDEFYPHELDASEVMAKDEWVKHPDTMLNSPVEKYRRVLAEWLERRAKTDKEVDHFTKAVQPLSWPPLQVDEFMTWDRGPFRNRGRLRATMVLLGREYLTWARPPTSALPLPAGKLLLVTGEVVEDSG
ncbi:hypothetical protein VTI74DRAFT_6743 [Chaetomium olivicolor]